MRAHCKRNVVCVCVHMPFTSNAVRAHKVVRLQLAKIAMRCVRICIDSSIFTLFVASCAFATVL